MPTPSLMEIPRSRSEEEFECLCTDILTNKYNQRFMRYGRNGQNQNGIDIFSNNQNVVIVAQCKNYFSLKLAKELVKKIERDINETQKTDFMISKFIAMTAMSRDTYVQNNIIKIEKTFEIELWFWEEIQQEVCSNIELL